MIFDEVGRLLADEVPPEFAFEWDNVGWMTGRLDEKLKGVLVCVDPSPDAIETALRQDCNLVLAHHPLIFDSIDGLVDSDPHQASIMRAVLNDVGVYCLHTNADCCPGGLNDVYSSYLGLNEKVPIEAFEFNENAGLGRVGNIPKAAKLKDIEQKLRQREEINYFRTVGDPEAEVDRLALCTGSGGDLLGSPEVLEADLYITGDLKHHDVETARINGLNLIVLDHYEMEVVFLEFARELLEGSLGVEVPVCCFERESPYRHDVKPQLLNNREVPE